MNILSYISSIATGVATGVAQFAGGSDPLTSGAINLLNYASTTILILVPIVGGVMVGITALKKMQSTDESEVTMLNKRMKTIVIYAAVGMVSMGLIRWVVSFFPG
jgi:uncharacterized membrane protein